MKQSFFDLNPKNMKDGYLTYLHTDKVILESHTHEYFEVILTETDQIMHVINGVEEMLPAGSLVLVRPGDVHKLWYDGEFCFISLNFSKEIFERLMEYLDDKSLYQYLLECFKSPVIQVTETERRVLFGQIIRAGQLQNDEKNRGGYNGAFYMRRTLLDIFITYLSKEKRESMEEMPDWFRQMLRQMEEHINFSCGVQRMEEISGRSIGHIARTMQKHLGLSPTEYVNTLRVQYAASLLMHSNIKILDIVLECGFQSESYFYQLFHDQMGMSPRQYRKRHKHYSEPI